MMSESSLEESLRNRCEVILKYYQEQPVKTAFSTILILLKNMINKPHDDQMRLFKKTNNAIKSKILIIKETKDLMSDIGYIDVDSELMLFSDPNLTNVSVAIRVLDSYVQSIDKKIAEREEMEELKRQEDIRRQNEEIANKFREEKKRQLEIQKRIEDDKREKAKMEKPTDSVSKKIDYGAKVCKFEPTNRGG